MFVPDDDGHIRIIMQVDRSQAAAGLALFTTAESTVETRSATDPRNGPRSHDWRYRHLILPGVTGAAADASARA